MSIELFEAFYEGQITPELILEYANNKDILERKDPNDEDNTILMLCVRVGLIDCVHALITAKANVNARNLKNSSVLHMAVEHDQAVCLLALIKAGADITVNYQGTPFIWACTKGYVACVNILLAAGAQIEETGYGSGYTGLMWAADQGHSECIKTLLAHKAKIDARDVYGNTALIWAAKEKRVDCITVLLKANAEINLKCYKERTALFYAVTKNQHESVLTLMSYGAYGNHVGENIHPENLLKIIQSGQQLNPEVVMALKTFCYHQRFFPQWVPVNAALSESKLKKAESYLQKLERLHQLHLKNITAALDLGTSGRMPIVLLDMIKEYLDPIVESKDRRLQTFKPQHIGKMLALEQYLHKKITQEKTIKKTQKRKEIIAVHSYPLRSMIKKRKEHPSSNDADLRERDCFTRKRH